MKKFVIAVALVAAFAGTANAGTTPITETGVVTAFKSDNTQSYTTINGHTYTFKVVWTSQAFVAKPLFKVNNALVTLIPVGSNCTVSGSVTPGITILGTTAPSVYKLGAKPDGTAILDCTK